jgi:hypothetical protein
VVAEAAMVNLTLLFQELQEVLEVGELIMLRHRLFQFVEEQVIHLPLVHLKDQLEEMVILQMEQVQVVEELLL